MFLSRTDKSRASLSANSSGERHRRAILGDTCARPTGCPEEATTFGEFHDQGPKKRISAPDIASVNRARET